MLGDPLPQPGVLQDRRVVSAEVGGYLVEHPLSALNAADQAYHRPVGLILRERLLQQPVRLLRAYPVHQVDRHVVRRGERAAQREGPGGRQARDLSRFAGVFTGVPKHHGVAFDVDAAPSGSPGELGVLPRRQRNVLFAVEFHQPFQHHRAGRHVDAERQRFGGEHRLDQPCGEQLLDRVPEHRQHAGVVGGDTAQQPFPPLVVAEHRQVGILQVAAAMFDHLGDLRPVLLGGQPQ